MERGNSVKHDEILLLKTHCTRNNEGYFVRVTLLLSYCLQDGCVRDPRGRLSFLKFHFEAGDQILQLTALYLHIISFM